MDPRTFGTVNRGLQILQVNAKNAAFAHRTGAGAKSSLRSLSRACGGGLG